MSGRLEDRLDDFERRLESIEGRLAALAETQRQVEVHDGELERLARDVDTAFWGLSRTVGER